MKINYLSSIIILSLVGGSWQCTPEENDFELGASPAPPTFDLEILPDDPNRVVVQNTTEDVFNLVWDAPGGTPNRSTKPVDTIFYASRGTYAISLHAAQRDGSGTSSARASVVIEQDAEIACDETISALTDECTERCWRLTGESGAIQVGPQPLSSEWFSSSGLESTQLDDLWCFAFEDAVHEYRNNGSSFSACQGYVEDPNYPVPEEVNYQIGPADTDEAELKITLTDPEAWIGVEDSGPEYEIVTLTDTELVLLSRIKPCDGADSPGWFTLHFVAQ